MTQLSTSEINGLGDVPMPNGLKVLTGVRAIVCAAHRSREGNLHGHTWTVRAWWTGRPCALECQAELNKYLSIFDHQELGPEHAWGEALAQSILLGLQCERVEVSREAEGIYAEAYHPHPGGAASCIQGAA